MITDEDLANAVDRIARTHDGKLLYLYLQKRLMGVVDVANPDSGALQSDHGERRFASKLMSLMAAGIDESAGRTDQQSNGGPTERPVVFRVPQPVGQRRLTARKHIFATDPEFASVRSGTDNAGS